MDTLGRKDREYQSLCMQNAGVLLGSQTDLADVSGTAGMVVVFMERKRPLSDQEGQSQRYNKRCHPALHRKLISLIRLCDEE